MSLFTEVMNAYKSRGFYGVKRLIVQNYFRSRPKRIRSFDQYRTFFEGKTGIEIGGTSAIFSNEIPIYELVEHLDGCNFSEETVWEGQIKAGQVYNFYGSKNGYQYVCEASDLKQIETEKYDFLISSHCLEHCANVLKTLEEWLRVIKKNGAILLILPDKNRTFDHNRAVTNFHHLLEDYHANIDESDLTHLNEILELHDLRMDSAAGSYENFMKRSKENLHNRCLHHHVFDFDLMEQIYRYFNIDIIDTSYCKPYHQIILGIKR